MASDEAADNLIVCYGHDRLRLARRLLTLESTSAKISPVLKGADYRAEVCRLLPQVIVLCQSLSMQERLMAIDYAEKMSPRSKILIMVNTPDKCQAQTEHPELWGEGPAAFVKTVKELMVASRRGRIRSVLESPRPLLRSSKA